MRHGFRPSVVRRVSFSGSICFLVLPKKTKRKTIANLRASKASKASKQQALIVDVDRGQSSPQPCQCRNAAAKPPKSGPEPQLRTAPEI